MRTPVYHSAVLPISSTHNRHTQIEFPLGYITGLRSTSFGMYCNPAGGGGVGTGRVSVYISTCGVVKYRGSENVTPMDPTN